MFERFWQCAGVNSFFLAQVGAPIISEELLNFDGISNL